MIIAFWLEAWLSKQEILSRYLSSVYFGDGVYGLRAAAHHYFNREPEDLSLRPVGDAGRHGAGSLAARADAQPHRRAEARQARPPGDGRHRRDQIDRGRAPPLRHASVGPFVAAFRPAPDFADWVTPFARQAQDPDFGEVKVRTTLDWRLQRIAERAVARAPAGAQAALVAMRPDGRVVAMVGGRSYAQSPFNRVTQARRQPGSAFKLFVYLAALRSGWTPDSMIEDRPITIDGWSPENSDGVYRGQDHAARGLRALEQRGDGAACQRKSGATM